MSIPSKEKLLKLQKKYKTDAAIGDLFGVSRQAVHLWRVKHGIKSLLELTEARNYLINKDFKAGKDVPKLAKKFKMSFSQIYRILKNW